jgi:hypothetical protein
MNESHDIRPTSSPDSRPSLLDEVRLYLEAVELFRREGHEPSWRHEPAEKEVLR